MVLGNKNPLSLFNFVHPRNRCLVSSLTEMKASIFVTRQLISALPIGFQASIPCITNTMGDRTQRRSRNERGSRLMWAQTIRSNLRLRRTVFKTAAPYLSFPPRPEVTYVNLAGR